MAFLRMLFQVACVVVMLSKMAAAASLAKPSCQHRCGDVEIPYPFGTTENCYLNHNYFINCSNSKPLFGNLIVNNIDSIQGELEVLMFIAHQCYQNSSGVPRLENSPSLRVKYFTISNTKNKFVAIGCDTYAFLNAFQNNEPFSIGCTSTCQSLRNVFKGSCSGIGCCQVEIPKGLKNFTLEARSYNNHAEVWDFSPCSFAFVAKEGKFKFSPDYLKNKRADINDTFPMVLDWAIGNKTCETARSKPDYVCGRNSACYDPENGDGYRCKCNKGYEGNPYLPHGCQDINECQVRKPACNATAKCTNIKGSFKCTCPDGYEGDGKIDGTGCSPKASDSQYSKIIIIAVIGSSSIGFLGQ